MKILLQAGVDLALPGGVETHVIELARGLIARKHEVEIGGRPASFAPFHMVSKLDPSRYDIVHQHGGIWPRHLAPGPRYVRTFHFSVAARMKTYLGMGRLRTLVNPGNYSALAEERAAIQRPGAKIAVSEKLKGELSRHHGLEPARVHVIPNGARFLAPTEPRVALRARFGIPEESPMLLTIGRDDYVKGIDLLARAWEGAGVAQGGAKWVAIGGSAPGQRGGRMWTGPLVPQDVANWIHAADVGAFPSYYEGGGIALLEMLAGRLYALTHDVGTASEVIRPGNGEIVARSLDAWIAALRRALSRAPARGATALSDAYRWEAIVARVESVYAETLAAAAPARERA